MEFLNCTKGCFKWQVTQKYAKVLRFGSFAFFTTDLIFKALKKCFSLSNLRKYNQLFPDLNQQIPTSHIPNGCL